MRYRLTVALLGAAIVAAGQAAPALGQAVCGDRADILANLEGAYLEMPRAIALTSDGAVLEIVASPTGSWTMLITYPNRPTCLMAAGEAWESVPLLVSDQPA